MLTLISEADWPVRADASSTLNPSSLTSRIASCWAGFNSASNWRSTVALVIDVADDVWNVVVDPNEFETALVNLVINARDAMPQGGDRRSRLKEERQWLLQQIKEFPDATLTELQDALAQRGIRVGYGTVWRFFDREGISFKKKSLRRGAKTR